ncbi:HesB/IscA family protein [Candidatus Spongiihabitans sp.]|uniref:HesB/IscA family protein n=1 Tax=Candidatus Spongiihabitans sp. TaxID=3101308 RepID=UPI003C79CDDE
MSITLTQAAAQQVSSHLATRGQSRDQARDQCIGLRVTVKNSGCSGYAYQLDYATEINDIDQVFESHGVKIVVQQDHLELLQGMELDYVEDGLSSAFHFNNPNVTEQCGCGESFTVK